MTIWHPDSAALTRPKYLSLAEQMAAAIERGDLSPGQRLPTHRGLSDSVGVSVQTVSRAYEELIRRGLLVGEVGRGTFVRPGPAEPAMPFRDARTAGLIDLSLIKPVADNRHERRLAETLEDLAAGLPADLVVSFRPNVGIQRHREAAAEWLHLCGLSANPESVIITNGVTSAQTVSLMTLSRPGAVLLTEAIGHHAVAALASFLGYTVRGVTIDDDGIVPDALDQACGDGDVRALFITPSAANPTATMVSKDRRKAIVEVARRHDIFILENDAWGPLMPDRPPPFSALAPERSFHMSGFTKCLMPGLRTGYLVVPPMMMAAARNRQVLTSWMATPLIAEVVYRWVRDGTAWDLVRWQQNALSRRHRIVEEEFSGMFFRSARYGLHVWLPLPEQWGVEAFVAHALASGVAIAPGKPFLIDPSSPSRAVRVALASTSEDELRHGLQTVARAFHERPEPLLDPL